MAHLQTELISHTRRVQSLYKRALRNLEAWSKQREQYRYGAVVIRARFDKHKNELDMRKAKELLRLGEEELFNGRHTHPMYFPESPGGVAYERTVQSPDWLLDYWHPEEKAAYPDYFARREARKAEYLEFWNKQYGGPDAGKNTDGHH